MTKQELIDLFPNFAKSAIREFDDGFELVDTGVRINTTRYPKPGWYHGISGKQCYCMGCGRKFGG